jgi:glucose-1-phosphatase
MDSTPIADHHPVLMLDLGNVVFSLNFAPFESWFRKTISGKCEEKLEAFWGIYAEYEGGNFGDKDFLDRIRNDLESSFEDRDFTTNWNTCWEHDMPGLDAWLDRIVGSLPVCVLSNTNGIHMECFLRKKKVLQRFDRLFLSHELRCRKPELDIYERVREELDVPPSSILFFDDRPENVEGARKAGWEAEIFVGIGESASRLEEHLRKNR